VHLFEWNKILFNPICSRARQATPSNPTYLSLGHFLIGESLTQLPAIDYTNVKINRISMWQTNQQQERQFCQNWSTDYLLSLQRHHRCLWTTPNFQPGDLFLMKENNTTPLQWTTAVIKGTHTGKDRIIQVETIKTPSGCLNALIQILYLTVC